MNTQNKFTPGPWYAQGPKISEVAAGQTYYAIVSRNPETRNGTYVAPGFYYPHSAQTDEEAAANAQLIASAPRLLEALRGLWYWAKLNDSAAMNGHYHPESVFGKAAAAIEAATNNQ
jgi:hypothetical protein